MRTSRKPPPRSGRRDKRVSWLEEVRGKLEQHARSSVAAPKSARRAGVLVPLFVKEKELWLLFTKRSDRVMTHKGQVSFPGGREEKGDEDLRATAVRETVEEVGLEREKILVLGALSPIVTVTNYYVEPFVAAIPHPAALKPSAEEIAEIWEIPVSSLMAPTAVETRRLPDREESVLFYHYGAKTVWGATARILSELLGVLAGAPA